MKRNQHILKNWDIIHAILVTAGFLSFLLFKSVYLIVLCSGVSFLYFVLKNKAVFSDLKPLGGYANWVTIFRLLVLLLIGIFYKNFNDLTVAYVAIAALCLDGLDGFLARKFKTTSDFGATLDGETDALFVLLFSAIIYQLGYVGVWILWAGMLRYVYVLACYLLWRGVVDESVSYLRKTMAVVIMGAILTPLMLPYKYYFPAVLLSVVGVTLSFLKSFIFQIKNH